MTRKIAMLVSVAMAAGVSAQTVPVAKAGQRTVQQDFDAANALDAGTDRAAAVAAWEALEKRTATNRRSHAVVLVRKGNALVRAGRTDDGVEAARAGLADLPPADATLNGDRFSAYVTLGLGAEHSLDYAGAVESYERAEKLAEAAADKFSALLGLLRTQTFTDPAGAAKAAARTDALLATITADKTVIGEVKMREAVLALNRGDIANGMALSQASVQSLGGMTDRVDLRDVSARSTAAIAALLAGKTDDARRYMAMTGAGRMDTGAVFRGVQMKVPDCGGEAGLKPADFAVVEFSIADDGSVILASPVYAVGGGAVALEFARSVRDWSWDPATVKTLDPFFRHNARMELRCSVGFERPSVGKTVEAEMRAWLAEKGVVVAERRDGADATQLPAERAALAAATARDPDSLATLGALYQLLHNNLVGREERHDLAVRSLAIATKAGAPPLPLLGLDATALATVKASTQGGAGYRRAVAPLLSKPIYANDPQARSVLRLYLADETRSSRDKVVLLRQVADDTGLQRNDPLKVGALIRIASIEQQDNQPGAARAAFEQSGLAANQCAIIDTPPKLVSSGGTYPQEARQWGFEGYTRTQFDIAADGRVLNERAIMSYPPFVFTKAGISTIAHARYAKSYRPDGGIGCGAYQQGVAFRFDR